jgi:hypothetical protein
VRTLPLRGKLQPVSVETIVLNGEARVGEPWIDTSRVWMWVTLSSRSDIRRRQLTRNQTLSPRYRPHRRSRPAGPPILRSHGDSIQSEDSRRRGVRRCGNLVLAGDGREIRRRIE